MSTETTMTAYQARLEAERGKYEADMADMPPLQPDAWKWFASRDGETYPLSHHTREGVIDLAADDYEDGFHITEALHGGELDLAKAFDLDRFCEEIDSRFEDEQHEDFEGFMSDFTSDELADLETRMRQTIRRWQVETRDKSGHAARTWFFAASRNEEFMPAPEAVE